MPNLRLTDITLSQSTAITPTTLIHIVTTDDVSQNPAGSSYKAQLSQIYDGLSGYCVPDLYVSNIHSCSPLYINPLSEGDIYVGSANTLTVDLTNETIGIGTTSPTSKLHIIGSGTTSSGYGLKVQNSGGTDNFVVRNDGNVGIGITSPTSKLHIKTSGTTSLLKLESYTYPYSIGEINDVGTGIALGGGSSYNLTGGVYSRGISVGFQATTNTVEAGLAIGNYVNVTSSDSAIGIGNNITSSGVFSAAFGNLASATNTNSIMIGNGMRFTGFVPIVNNVPNTIGFGLNSDIPTMWVTGGNGVTGSTGNVGIGTSTPSEKLEVSGTVKSTSVSATTFSGVSISSFGSKGNVITNSSTTTAFLNFSGSNTVGGTGYTDFIRVTNNAAGATTPTKTFRIDSLGSFEIINNAYDNTLLNLTDSGNLTIPGRVKSNVNYSQTGGGASIILGASISPQTILSVSITTYGNPVMVCAYGDAENTGAGYWSKLQLWRDSSQLGAIVHTEGSSGSENSPFALTYIDAPVAGTYTYYLKANEISGGNITFGESTAPILNAREL